METLAFSYYKILCLVQPLCLNFSDGERYRVRGVGMSLPCYTQMKVEIQVSLSVSTDAQSGGTSLLLGTGESPLPDAVSLILQ